MNFLDVGANIGFYSLTAAKIVGDAGIVIACEPLQKNAQAILLSVLANKLENVRVLPFAASDIAFQAITMISHSATANAHVGNTTIGQFGFCTQTIILDDFLTSLSRLDVVKMDIESFELRAFRGMKKTLQKFVPNFITEFHPYAFQIISGDDPLEYLEEIKSIYKSISVIKKDGKLLSCDKVCDIMAYWQRVNDDAGTDGRLQIDLLAH